MELERMNSQTICAYRRYDNGYQRDFIAMYDKEFVDKLYTAFKQEWR
jgi:hypothetical protein